ncbi:MAG: terminase [Clostridiales bacterium]|nr:terminase [Clostridiales bacterium]
MTQSRLILSKKYKAFLKCAAAAEFLEGTTAAGKTTAAIFKFILKCAESSKKTHILSGLDLGTIEKNIINKDLGILDDFGSLVEYNSKGKGKYSLPHLVLHTSQEDKIIYVLGYDNKARWKKALGGQYGCLYIDEINIADTEYVREASMRCDYLLATLNPDDPSLPVYTEYINCARPLPEWRSETPVEILNMINGEPKPGWVHWFFSFSDNSGLTADKIEQIKRNAPKGTKLYKNKILGLRGRAAGLVFSNFDRARHVMPKRRAEQFLSKDSRQEHFVQFSSGLDTAYSQKSPDTTAMTFFGITDRGRCVELDERVYNNAELQIPLAPSDTVKNYIDFLERNRREWGLAKNVFVDNADQATITELYRYKRQHGCVYIFNNAYKKISIIDRINLQLGWFAQDSYFILEHCKNSIAELELYSWREDRDNTPEDGNDHCINSSQYAWLPYISKIGSEINGADRQNER